MSTCKISRGQVKCGKGCTQIINALKKIQRKEEKKKEQYYDASVSNRNGIFLSALRKTTRWKFEGEEESSSFEKNSIVHEDEEREPEHEDEEYSYEDEEYSFEDETYEEALEKLQRGEKKNKRKEKEKKSSRPKTGFDKTFEDKPYGEDISGGDGKGLKVKEGQKLSQKQLEMLETVAEENLEASTNPLCNNQNLFRFLFEKVRKHEQKIDLQESIFNRDNPLWP